MRTMIGAAHRALLRNVRDILRRQPAVASLDTGDGLPGLVVAGAEAEPWASATFSGRRHYLDLTLRGETARVDAAIGALATCLPGAEFDLPGHLVADIAMTDARTMVFEDYAVCEMRLEVLTIED